MDLTFSSVITRQFVFFFQRSRNPCNNTLDSPWIKPNQYKTFTSHLHKELIWKQIRWTMAKQLDDRLLKFRIHNTKLVEYVTFEKIRKAGQQWKHWNQSDVRNFRMSSHFITSTHLFVLWFNTSFICPHSFRRSRFQFSQASLVGIARLALGSRSAGDESVARWINALTPCPVWPSRRFCWACTDYMRRVINFDESN